MSQEGKGGCWVPTILSKWGDLQWVMSRAVKERANKREET